MSDIFPLPKFGLSSLIKAFANFTLKGSDEVSASAILINLSAISLVTAVGFLPPLEAGILISKISSSNFGDLLLVSSYVSFNLVKA